MWINTNDHADTNDSDKQTVDNQFVVCGREILLNRLLARPYRDPQLHVIPGPDPGSHHQCRTSRSRRSPG